MVGIVEGAVADQVQGMVQKAGSGGLMHLLTSPFRAIGGFINGAFSGLFSGIMWFGLPLLGLFSFAPQWATHMAERIGNPTLTDFAKRMENATFGERVTMLGAIGSMMGAGTKGVIEGGKHALSAPEDAPKANVAGTIGKGVVLAAVTAVGIGAANKIMGGNTVEGQPAAQSAPGGKTSGTIDPKSYE